MTAMFGNARQSFETSYPLDSIWRVKHRSFEQFAIYFACPSQIGPPNPGFRYMARANPRDFASVLMCSNDNIYLFSSSTYWANSIDSQN